MRLLYVKKISNYIIYILFSMLPEIVSDSALYGYMLFTVANVTLAFECVEIKYSLANTDVLDTSWLSWNIYVYIFNIIILHVNIHLIMNYIIQKAISSLSKQIFSHNFEIRFLDIKNIVCSNYNIYIACFFFFHFQH